MGSKPYGDDVIENIFIAIVFVGAVVWFLYEMWKSFSVN